MANLTRAQAKTILYNLGWRVNTNARLSQAIKDFQAGYNLKDAVNGTNALVVDGKLGPKTSAAMRNSEARRRAGRTTASANFSFRTVQCRCYKRSAGRYGSCRVIWQKRAAFQMMERYRKHNGAFPVVSACRCPSRNKAIGGSPTSRHVTGLACDVPAQRRPSWVRLRAIAHNIGFGRRSGLTKHIDMGAGRHTYVDGN